jgi:Brp/Blh family beta-carotene 15,15'-monooxygenase
MQADLSFPIRQMAEVPFARLRERRVFVFGALIGLLLLVCLAVEVVWGMPGWLVALPFALSLFFCGMPHGAMDWSIHRRLCARRSLAFAILAFAPYTALCVVCALLLFTAPIAYISLFLLLTLLHFGRADARIRTGRSSASLRETIRGIARAGAVVALPFTLQPVATDDAIARVSSLVGGPASLPPGFAEVFGVFGAIGIAVWLIDVALNSMDEPAVLRLLPFAVIATSVLLAPLFSVGVWFLLWHALRECVVLGGEPERPVRSVARTHVRSLPLMLPTLGLALALGVLAGAPAGLLGVAVVTLTLYTIFTPAHHLLQELASAREAQFGTGAG